MIRRVSVILSAVALIGGRRAAAFGQLRPEVVAGCYAFAGGAWNPPLTGRLTSLVFPALVRLDTIKVRRTSGWQLSPRLAFGGTLPMLATTPRWEFHGDTMALLWTQGATPMTVALRRQGAGWAGEAIALVDTGLHPLAPASRASVSLRRRDCLSAGRTR